MAGIIDIHTHAFPDAIAKTAITALERSGQVKAYLDGTVDGLITSMDQAGISASVVCTVATRIVQFQPLLDWCCSIRSDRIIPFPSIHPADPQMGEHLEKIRALGFKGIKLHPYVQDFTLDDPALDPLIAALSDLGLLLILHTGYDIASPRIRRAAPQQVHNLLIRFPHLRLITTHLGGWDDWDEVRSLLTGRPIYMELSFALDFLDQIRLRDMLLSHPPEYLLFGTASPWSDQATTLKMLRRMNLDAGLLEMITSANAARLLDL